MTNVNKIETYNHNTEQNIIYSLDYLKKEAKKEGSTDLYMILEIAHDMALNPSIINEKVQDIDDAQDVLAASYFVFKYLSASKEIQSRLLSEIND